MENSNYEKNKVAFYRLVYEAKRTRPVFLEIPNTLIVGFGYSLPVSFYTLNSTVSFHRVPKEQIKSQVKRLFPENKGHPNAVLWSENFQFLTFTSSQIINELNKFKNLVIEGFVPPKNNQNHLVKLHWVPSSSQIEYLDLDLEKSTPVRLTQNTYKIDKSLKAILGFIKRTSTTPKQLQLEFRLSTQNKWVVLNISFAFEVSKKPLKKPNLGKLVIDTAKRVSSTRMGSPREVVSPLATERTKPGDLDSQVNLLIGSRKPKHSYKKWKERTNSCQNISSFDKVLAKRIVSRADEFSHKEDIRNLKSMAKMLETFQGLEKKKSKVYFTSFINKFIKSPQNF